MVPNDGYWQVANEEDIGITKEALERSGIRVLVVDSGEDALKDAIKIIPEWAEVMNMTSVTLAEIWLEKEILESGRYKPARTIMTGYDRNTEKLQMKKIGCAHEWTVWSVHAITKTGHVLIASKTGSQLASYVYGAEHVLWIVGAQKITEDLEEWIRRIYEYSYPLEDARAQKAYGTGSWVNKLLILNKEVVSERITMIIIRQNIGY